MKNTSLELISKASPILFSFLWIMAICVAFYHAFKNKNRAYIFPYLLTILILAFIISTSLFILATQWVDGNYSQNISFVDHQWNTLETGISVLGMMGLHYHYLLMHKTKPMAVDFCHIPLITQMRTLDFKTLCLIISSCLTILFFIGFMVLALTGNLDALKIFGELLTKGIEKL
jgi:glucose-6-phosphate-specific signal transduction histidine kinase